MHQNLTLKKYKQKEANKKAQKQNIKKTSEHKK